MTLPDVHLAGEAVAAYVDDALSPTARDRAERHLLSCAECRAVVGAQREAKVLLAAALDPEPSSGLVARLRDIPMTTDLGGSDIVYAVDGDQFGWARMPVWPEVTRGVQFAGHGPPVGAMIPTAVGAAGAGLLGAGSDGVGLGGGRLRAGLPVVPAEGVDSGPTAAGRRAAGRGDRPESYPSAFPSLRRRRSRRMAGALAGLAFGVIASAASTGSSSSGLPAQRVGGSSGDPPRLVIDRGPVSGEPLQAGTLTVSVPTQRRAALLPGPGR